MLYIIAVIVLFLPITIFFPTKIIGKKKLPKRPYIIVSNHTSNFDCIVLDIRLGKKLYFMAKKELFKPKIKGFFIKHLGGYKVDRGGADLGAIKTSFKLLKKKKILAIFPEGTRNKARDIDGLLSVHNGAIVIAQKADVPIVPVVIEKRPKIFRRNRIVIGDPIFPNCETPKHPTKEETDAMTHEMVSAINDLRQNLR